MPAPYSKSDASLRIITSFCRQVLRHGFHFLFPCKPASHAHLSSWIQGRQAQGRLNALKLKLKGKSNRWDHHPYRWANGVPLTDSADALKVNWCEVTITDAHGTLLYRNACITDWKTWERLLDFMMRGLEIGLSAAQKS